MSTVRADAGIVPAQSTRDEERGADRRFQEDESPATGRLPERSVEEPDELGDDEHSLIRRSTSFRGYQDSDPDNQNDSDLASSPALGRPSSADGSLSIPDDTPSIQVSPIFFLLANRC